MIVLDFVIQKEEDYDLKAIEKCFGYIPIFKDIRIELTKFKEKEFNKCMSVFDVEVDDVDILEQAWNNIKDKYEKFRITKA